MLSIHLSPPVTGGVDPSLLKLQVTVLSDWTSVTVAVPEPLPTPVVEEAPAVAAAPVVEKAEPAVEAAPVVEEAPAVGKIIIV